VTVPAAPPPSVPSITVQLNYTEITVLDVFEQKFVTDLLASYGRELKFTLASDLQDLDRLLALELMVHRLSRWLAADADYNGDDLMDPIGCRRALQTTSESISKLKERMRIDPASREKDAGDTVDKRWNQLTRRAGQFAVHRLNQARMAIALFEEVHTLCATWERISETERAQLDLSPESIVRWVLDKGYPVFAKVDADFRANKQALWHRDED
jgi:hypothetical protein